MPEEPKPVVEVESEEKDTSQEQVDVTPVAKVSDEDQLAAKIKSDFETLYGSRIKQVEDRLHGAYRINEKLQKELDQLKKPSIPHPAPVDVKDPWSTIQDGYVWKSEIERLAEQKAKELYQQQLALQEAQAEIQRQDTIREHWKQTVQTKYPDLSPDGDPNSPISITFNEVLNEHPEYLRNPFGPRLAMEDMEAKLQEKGIAATPSGTQELARRTRAAAATTPPSRTALPASQKLTISREDKAFCDRHAIKYEEFVKNRAALEQGAVEA